MFLFGLKPPCSFPPNPPKNKTYKTSSHPGIGIAIAAPGFAYIHKGDPGDMHRVFQMLAQHAWPQRSE